MAYVDGLLVGGETVIRRETQHWFLPFYIAGKWVMIALAVGLISLVLNVWLIPSGGEGFFGGLFGFVSTLATWITIIALVIAVVGFAWSAARWKTQEYVLTNQRVIHVRGVVNRQSSDSQLESLTDAGIEVPLLGRMLGWGNLTLMTANEGGNMRMLALRDPIAFKKDVMEAKTARTILLNTATRPATAAPAPVAAPAPAPVPAAPQPASVTGEDISKTLTALAGLRDSGAITPEEYEAKKQELLSRL